MGGTLSASHLCPVRKPACDGGGDNMDTDCVTLLQWTDVWHSATTLKLKGRLDGVLPALTFIY